MEQENSFDVVDEDVDGAETIQRALGQFLGIAYSGNVAGYEVGLSFKLFNLLCDLPARFFLEICNDRVDAFVRQLQATQAKHGSGRPLCVRPGPTAPTHASQEAVSPETSV